VVLKTIPLDQQQVAKWRFDAPFETHGPASRHRGNDRAGRTEGFLEVSFLTRNDVEQRVLKDHCSNIAL
jgi:hypothetical protein